LIPRLPFPSTNDKSLATQSHNENSKDEKEKRGEKEFFLVFLIPLSFIHVYTPN
jgi:hypothetical protein